jgi:hypothetical protein
MMMRCMRACADMRRGPREWVGVGGVHVCCACMHEWSGCGVVHWLGWGGLWELGQAE